MPRCQVCNLNEAKIDPTFGVIPCEACQAKPHPSPDKPIEFTSDSIKEQRKEYKDDIQQWHRQGRLNKRKVELVGKEAAKARGYSDREIKEATFVYDDDNYYSS